jgi:hypothetical protein
MVHEQKAKVYHAWLCAMMQFDKWSFTLLTYVYSKDNSSAEKLVVLVDNFFGSDKIIHLSWPLN